jgi:hypothetical protein
LPNLTLGCRVKLESRNINGVIKIIKMNYTGDNRDGAFEIEHTGIFI